MSLLLWGENTTRGRTFTLIHGWFCKLSYSVPPLPLWCIWVTVVTSASRSSGPLLYFAHSRQHSVPVPVLVQVWGEECKLLQ